MTGHASRLITSIRPDQGDRWAHRVEIVEGMNDRDIQAVGHVDQIQAVPGEVADMQQLDAPYGEDGTHDVVVLTADVSGEANRLCQRIALQHLVVGTLHAQHFDLAAVTPQRVAIRSEEHTSELQSLMRISYAVFCLKKKKQ